MAKKYCKKTSMQAVADEVKVRGGFPDTYKIQGSYMATEIANLEKPVNRGSPSVTLTASSPSYTAQEGKYTGGSVSVVPQNATAQLSQNGGYVTTEDGKTLASVKVPAKNTYSYSSGLITPNENSTSISITGLSFVPTHFVLINTLANYKVQESVVASIYCDTSGSLKGMFPAKMGYWGSVTGVNVSFGSNYVSINNIVGIRQGTAINGIFRNVEYSWFAWG